MIMMEDDPINIHQAIQSFDSQKWIDAMNDEYKSMQDNDVWDLLGFIVNSRGIEANPDEIKVVLDMLHLQTLRIFNA